MKNTVVSKILISNSSFCAELLLWVLIYNIGFNAFNIEYSKY